MNTYALCNQPVLLRSIEPGQLTLHFDDQLHVVLEEVDTTVPLLVAQIDLATQLDARLVGELVQPRLEVRRRWDVVVAASLDDLPIDDRAVAAALCKVIQTSLC
jgi:hypothetical protein